MTAVPAPVDVPERQSRRTRVLVFAMALASGGFFFWHAVKPAWSRPSSDFPNYYTAAVLVREHQPLNRFYDWPWFQKQITLKGSGLQLGGYVPQTPITMLPFLPLSTMRPAVARRVWLIVNLFFLAAALALIAKTTQFRIATVWLIAFCSYPALRSNIVLGQYYFFLLAAFSLCAFCLVRGWERTAGVIAAITTALKLYGAPLLLFFAASKRFRAVWLMAATLVICICGAVLMFGWHDVEYFVRIILPRALTGETLDPYNAGNGSAATLLRRLFIAEPELNPHPLTDSARTFAFLWTAFTLLVTGAPLLAGAPESGTIRRSFAWWMIAMLVASPNTASYTFALLPLCSALLLAELTGKSRALIVAANILIALPLWAGWRAIYPRFWLLLLLFFVAGWQEMKRIRLPHAAIAGVSIFAISACAALLHNAADAPGDPVAVQSHAVYSNAAAVSRDAVAFESIGDERYELKLARANRMETFRFPGHAFHPSISESGALVAFETATPQGGSIMTLETGSGRVVNAPLREGAQDAVISPDGHLLAYTFDNTAYIFDGLSSHPVRTTHGIRDLAFSPDSRHLIYMAGAFTDARIEEVSPATGSYRVLLQSNETLAHPSLSPDGTWLAYAARGRWRNWTIEVQRNTDGVRARISAPGCNCYNPAWRPGSDEIIYSTDCRRGVLLPRLARVHASTLDYKALN